MECNQHLKKPSAMHQKKHTSLILFNNFKSTQAKKQTEISTIIKILYRIIREATSTPYWIHYPKSSSVTTLKTCTFTLITRILSQTSFCMVACRLTSQFLYTRLTKCLKMKEDYKIDRIELCSNKIGATKCRCQF